jgi:methionyl aminopeptidase
MVRIKSKKEIELIRESCQIVTEVLKLIGANAKPGISTRDLDMLAEDYIRAMHAEPAFKGYRHANSSPFPGTLCTSIDSEVVHGIPSGRLLRDGEILSIDVGVRKNGYFGDGAASFAIGSISEGKQHLMHVTEEALYCGIAEAKVGNRVHDISHAIQNHVESHGYSVVRDLVGHGVGKELHEEPAVPNFGKRGTGMKLKEGMTLAIEPMVNEGTWRVRVAPDGWTIITEDNKPSAHFEHTVAIVNGKAEILTQ